MRLRRQCSLVSNMLSLTGSVKPSDESFYTEYQDGGFSQPGSTCVYSDTSSLRHNHIRFNGPAPRCPIGSRYEALSGPTASG